AWTPNGLGGTMEFGGTLTPKDVVNPWLPGKSADSAAGGGLRIHRN
ncbi:hypothetical protein J9K58_004642, partial [Salmonella enterica]|nr:hypothetical protein [Salmonella enterica]